MGSTPAQVESKKFVGVVIFDFSDDGLTALKWAQDYLKLPEKYKLGIILIKQVNGQPPRENTGRALISDKPLDNWERMDGLIVDVKKEAGASDDEAREAVGKFQGYAKEFRKNIFAKIYEGGDIQKTLQYAIDKESDLDTLILGCAGADGGSHTMPQINNLRLSGCSIVLAKIDLGANLSLSAPAAPSEPPTQHTEGTNSDSTDSGAKTALSLSAPAAPSQPVSHPRSSRKGRAKNTAGPS